MMDCCEVFGTPVKKRFFALKEKETGKRVTWSFSEAAYKQLMQDIRIAKRLAGKRRMKAYELDIKIGSNVYNLLAW